MLKTETCTSKIERVLREADDFLTVAMIMERSGCSMNQASATLHHFFLKRVAAFVADANGTWWFAMPPEDDRRLRHVDERTPEKKPRKRKRKLKMHDD